MIVPKSVRKWQEEQARLLAAEPESSIVLRPVGFTYRCTHCDVTEHLAQGETKMCWSCESSERIKAI
jgi:hypothetical protein